MSPHRQKYFRYIGRSMWPCFQEGDLLEIEPIVIDRARVGDCLLFTDPDGQLVVHRLTAKHSGLRTRGDFSAEPDAFEVLPKDIRGRVICRYRLEQRSRVAGGRLGLLAGKFYRFAGRIDPDRASRGGQLARAILRCSSCLLKPVWNSGKVRTLHIQGKQSIVVWQLWGNQIGHQNPSNGRWQVRWPWRVFVKLPQGMG